jgi:hypothetical protein
MVFQPRGWAEGYQFLIVKKILYALPIFLCMPHVKKCYTRPRTWTNFGQIKDDEEGGTCSMHVDMGNEYTIFVGEPEGNRPLGKPMHRWEDNIKINLSEIRLGGLY